MSSIIFVIAWSFSDRKDDSSWLAAGGPAANAGQTTRPDIARAIDALNIGRAE